MGYIEAAARVAGLAYGIIQGERGRQAQKKGLRLQGEAQQTAEDAAMRQERQAMEAQRRANQRKPDISALLAGEQGLGVSSMLSGPAGVALNRLRLGRSSALGG